MDGGPRRNQAQPRPRFKLKAPSLLNSKGENTFLGASQKATAARDSLLRLEAKFSGALSVGDASDASGAPIDGIIAYLLSALIACKC